MRKRTKSALKKIAFHELSWGPIHKVVFKKVKESLKSAVKLGHIQEKHVISVFTDASDEFWAGIVTQMDQARLKKNYNNKITDQ